MHLEAPVQRITFLTFLILATILSAATASQPPRFNYQARVTDSSGTPLAGSHSCVFRIYDGGTAATTNSGTLKYEETASPIFTAGLVSHAVGTGTPVGAALSDAVFSTNADLFLQVAVDGTVILPRTRLESVPFAINAANGAAQTPITSVPFTISAPGSYYLVSNLTGIAASSGIIIAADNVTLDLNGFALIGSGTSFNGILISGTRANFTVRNGTVTNWPSAGISGATAHNCELANLRVSACGNDGIAVGPGNSIHDCLVENSGTGIQTGDRCIIRNCTSQSNPTKGIAAANTATVDHCTVVAGAGISVGTGSIVESCSINGATGNGIGTSTDCSINRCVARLCTGTGISVNFRCVVSECVCDSNLLNGILAGSEGAISDCTSSSNTLDGINVLSSVVTHCLAHSNGDNGIHDISTQGLTTIIGCSTQQNGTIVSSTGRNGILVGRASVLDCSSRSNAADGIRATAESNVERCLAAENTGDGIHVNSDCRIAHNNCDSNGVGTGDGAGIHISNNGNRIESNNVSDNDRGIDLDDGHNLVIGNSASGNTTAYDFVLNNRYGAIIDISANGGAAVGSNATATSTMATTDPYANVMY